MREKVMHIVSPNQNGDPITQQTYPGMLYVSSLNLLGEKK